MLADNRKRRDEILPADEAEIWKLDGEGLANYAGLSAAELRRALEAADTEHSTAGPVAGWRGQALADLLDPYDSHVPESEELHRRYPHLLGILAALGACRPTRRRTWRASSSGRSATSLPPTRR
ncbi:hypothetical protein [Kitasatospora sp. NPDC088134]|uniref:hypothetical protein n=1 Tax=Kitasatospora sp. NPDC088134 TaxID=3364071 RepID=UPI00380104D7